jgi:hypothetical protein
MGSTAAQYHLGKEVGMTVTLCDDDALRDLSKGIVYTYMSEVEGDIAEFGCFWGVSAKVLAENIAQFDRGQERKLWLFDSFKGLPDATLPPDTESPHVKSGAWTWKVSGDANVPTPSSLLQGCAAHLPVSRLRVVPGWYKDTLDSIPTNTKFALVHIDCDLYESTYQVLDHLLGNDMLSDGCVLFFDDWYCNRGNPQYGEQRAWEVMVSEHCPSFTDWGPYGTVGRKFIVHV